MEENNQNKNSEKIRAGSIRPSQFFVSYGPGSIHSGVHDSVTIRDIDYWNTNGMTDINEPGLAGRLGVEKLKGFPIVSISDSSENTVSAAGGAEKKKNEWGIPVVSFPEYHICKNCGRLFRVRPGYENYNKNKGPLCPNCNGESYPAGFVIACSNGHMEDFPWSYIVHNGKDVEKVDENYNTPGCDKEELYLEVDLNSREFAPRKIRCKGCGAEITLSDREIWRMRFPCRCKNPHRRRKEREYCEEKMRPLRRDSSSVYFPVTQRTVSIPFIKDEIDEYIAKNRDFIYENIDEIIYNDLYGSLEDFFKENYNAGIIAKERPDSETESEFDRFLNAWNRIKDEARNTGSLNIVLRNLKDYGAAYDFENIKEMEHHFIFHFENPCEKSQRKPGASNYTNLVVGNDKKFISKLVCIPSLSEVNALIGFTRVEAPDTNVSRRYKSESGETITGDRICRLGAGESSWLPAVEIKGEGIFLELNIDRVREWEQSPTVTDLSETYRSNYEKFLHEEGWSACDERGARYVMLHTLSHLLIKELSLYSGYELPSLKERIYCSDDMCGVLIYTGSSDREGSLGGLAELGIWTKFSKILRSALKKALSCPQDPGCSFSKPLINSRSKTHSLCGAACYSCAMVPATACENQNQMLDRALLVPLSGREDAAFFSMEFINKST